jgi:hypothetical protein
VPPVRELPHAVIEPSALRAAKASKIYSTWDAFAALKADGSITAWGDSGDGGTGAPSDNGYTKPLSEGAPLPPQPELPHATIDPSALRAAKACLVE